MFRYHSSIATSKTAVESNSSNSGIFESRSSLRSSNDILLISSSTDSARTSLENSSPWEGFSGTANRRSSSLSRPTYTPRMMDFRFSAVTMFMYDSINERTFPLSDFIKVEMTSTKSLERIIASSSGCGTPSGNSSRRIEPYEVASSKFMNSSKSADCSNRSKSPAVRKRVFFPRIRVLIRPYSLAGHNNITLSPWKTDNRFVFCQFKRAEQE